MRRFLPQIMALTLVFAGALALAPAAAHPSFSATRLLTSGPSGPLSLVVNASDTIPVVNGQYQSIDVAITIKNTGTATAHGVELQMLIPDDLDTNLTADFIGDLAASQEIQRIWSIRVAPGAPATGEALTYSVSVLGTSIDSVSVEKQLTLPSRVPNLRVVANIPVSSIDSFDGIAVNQNNGRAYVTSRASNSISIIDGNTYAVSPHTVDKNLLAIAVNPQSGIVYTSHYTSSTDFVALRDGNDLHVIHSVPTRLDPVLEGRRISIDSVHGIAYVAPIAAPSTWHGWMKINESNYSTATYIAQYQLDFAPYDIAVNPSTQHVYVSTDYYGTYIFDNNMNLIGGMYGNTGVYPSLAVNAQANKVYASDGGDLNVFDDNTLSVVATFSNRPYNKIAYNSANHHLYAIEAPNKLHVLDGDTLQELAPITVGSANTNLTKLAVDENAGKVWLVDSGLQQVHVVQDTAGLPLAIRDICYDT